MRPTFTPAATNVIKQDLTLLSRIPTSIYIYTNKAGPVTPLQDMSKHTHTFLKFIKSYAQGFVFALTLKLQRRFLKMKAHKSYFMWHGLLFQSPLFNHPTLGIFYTVHNHKRIGINFFNLSF